MAKIVRPDEGILIAHELSSKNKKIVLAGGCFDILHEGHLEFAKESKRKGDSLFLLLESDENVRRKKGDSRPINNQSVRAKNLAKLKTIDYIILLPLMTNDSDYDTLLSQINPKVITATEGDEELRHKKRQAKKLDAQLMLIKKFGDISTSRILKENGNTRSNKTKY